MSSKATQVDERVVSMQFDNQQFEKNVQTSIGTIDKLKQSLNLTGAAKGLENVGDASRKVDMSPLTGAVEAVSVKFSALQIAATTALANIVNSAVDAGKRMVAALTVDPIMAGFSEYETQMNAVQTILANTESKGKTLDDVNNALDQLNAYADKTIYNFTEMTRNIGTFTAAGVDLDTSVSAIKGIANLAAVSGSNSQQASMAMYQLSQALSSGTVKLMDWNSVVNAGMGGQVFQDALKETARLHGVKIDEMIEKEGSFRETLQNGWLSSKILTETLSKFTGDLTEEQLKSMGYTDKQIESIMKMGKTANDAATKVKTFTQLMDTLKEAAQSGWTQTWEILVGDFEEAKELFTKVSDTIGEMIGASAESRNELIENWKVLGGRTHVIDAIANAFNGVMSIVNLIKEAFREIFPPMVAEDLIAFTSGLKSLTEKFVLSDNVADNLKRTFKGLFAVLDIVKQLFSAVVKAGSSLFGTVGDIGGGILDLTAFFGDLLVKLSDSIRESGIFVKVFQGIADIIKAAVKGISSFVKFVKDKFVSPGMVAFKALLEKVKDAMSGIGGAAGSMKDGVVKTFDSMSSALQNCGFFKLLQTLWNGIVKIGSGIIKFFGSLINDIINSFDSDGLSGVLDLINTLISGGIGISIMNFIKGLSEPLEGLSDLFEGLGDCLEGFQQKLKAEALMKIATAIAILAASVLVLSTIKAEGLTTAITAMTVLFTELLVSMKILGKFSKDSIKGVGSMIAISAALLLLSFAMKLLSTMSWDEMKVGLAATVAGLGALLIAINALPDNKVNKAAKTLTTISTALLILSVAIKIMSSMSFGEMMIGLITMAASLAALVVAMNFLPKDATVKAGGMIAIAAALLILSVAIKIMSTMSFGEMIIGLLALAGTLAIVVTAMNVMQSAIPGALAMLIIAPALLVLAGALKLMSTMSLGEMVISLVALAGSLAILAVAMNAMVSAIPGALAMLIIAPALLALTTSLLLLGAMSWEGIIKGLVGLAGAFTIIGVAGYLLAPIIPSILALAGAMTLIGIGILAAGVGMIAFAAGLTALATAFTALAASMAVIVNGMVSMIFGLITGILKGISDAAKYIFEAVKTVIVSVCDALAAAIPAIINVVAALLDSLLAFIVEYVPKLVDAGLKLITGLLKGIADNIGSVISTAVDVVLAFIKGIADQIPKVVQAGLDLIYDFINALARGIVENTQKVLDTINNLMSSIFEAIGMAIGNVPKLGSQIIQGLVKGIKASAGDLINGLVGTVKNAWNGVKKFLGIKSPSRLAAEAGMYIDQGLAVGLEKYSDVAGNAATGVAKTTMNSLSEAISKIPNLMNGDMDLQPTIRPVIDLSEVKNGADSIGQMLNFGSSIGVEANVGAISSAMSQKNQNGGNDDVVSAIDKLRDRLSNIGNTTYTINGVTYDDGSNIANAIETIIRAANIERRA